MVEQCVNCRFYYRPYRDAVTAGDNAGLGMCRRYAPTTSESLALRVESSNNPGIFMTGGGAGGGTRPANRPAPPAPRHVRQGPFVGDADWCGDWEAIGQAPGAVYADWLEERGHTQAAADLRAGFNPPETK